MTRCAAAALTLLLLVEKGHSERVEAVLLLHDDDIHTFGSVSSALEALGLSPPQALLVTSDVHSSGIGLVCKGAAAELAVARRDLVAERLNVSLRTTEATDAEVRRAAKLISSGTPAARRLHVGLRTPPGGRACLEWSLAGACVREPMAMYVDLGCAAECVENTARFQEAAHHRLPLRADLAALQVAGVLGGALGMAEVWMRLAVGEASRGGPLPAALAASARIATTLLIAQHFLISGLSEALSVLTGADGEEGTWRIDDSEVVVSFTIEEEGEGSATDAEGRVSAGGDSQARRASNSSELHTTRQGEGAGVGADSALAEPEDGPLSWLAALVFLLGGLLSAAPPWLSVALALLQSAAAVVALRSIRAVEGSAADAAAAAAGAWSAASLAAQAEAEAAARWLRRSGALLLLVSILGAVHVFVSAGYMYVMEAGVHLSEVMAKRICLVGGVALWLAHVTLAQPGESTNLGAGATAVALPLSKRDVGALPPGARGRMQLRAALLAAGRMLVAMLLAAVGGTELWRLVGTPFTSFDSGDGHDALYLRAPQLALALPLALGAATSRVSSALALLLLGEALLVWLPRCVYAAGALILAAAGMDGEWDGTVHDALHSIELAEMMPRLATATDHLTVNLAVAGALLLLPAFGTGRYSLDALIKKRD